MSHFTSPKSSLRFSRNEPLSPPLTLQKKRKPFSLTSEQDENPFLKNKKTNLQDLFEVKESSSSSATFDKQLLEATIQTEKSLKLLPNALKLTKNEDERKLTRHQWLEFYNYTEALETKIKQLEGKNTSLENTKVYLRNKIADLENQLKKNKYCSHCGEAL
jgi:NADH pyrophosphatase NudC (nudix superfamily)